MDRDRFSRIGHGDLPWWNPIDGADFDRLIARAALPAGARVLDVGCGNGNLLRRALAGIPGATGVGVDRRLPVPGPDLREEPFDAAREDLRDLDGTAAFGPEAGLENLAVAPTSRGAWDRYEDTYAGNIERFAAEHPEDPDAPAMLARIRPWREGYLRWGRTTLGFALLLFRRPA